MTSRIKKLPKWAQQLIVTLWGRVEKAEKTMPWTRPGMEWFTLFSPATLEKRQKNIKLFVLSDEGAHHVCTIGPEDFVFVGRGNPKLHPQD